MTAVTCLAIIAEPRISNSKILGKRRLIECSLSMKLELKSGCYICPHGHTRRVLFGKSAVLEKWEF